METLGVSHVDFKPKSQNSSPFDGWHREIYWSPTCLCWTNACDHRVFVVQWLDGCGVFQLGDRPNGDAAAIISPGSSRAIPIWDGTSTAGAALKNSDGRKHQVEVNDKHIQMDWEHIFITIYNRAVSLGVLVGWDPLHRGCAWVLAVCSCCLK